MLDALQSLKHECSTMKEALCISRDEISQLRERLRRRRLPEINLAKLRRRIAFHCHPDSNGDELLMKDVNLLFDYLES